MTDIQLLLQADPATLMPEEKQAVREYLEQEIARIKTQATAPEEAPAELAPSTEVEPEEPGILDTISDEVKGLASMVVNDPFKTFSKVMRPAANGVISAINETLSLSNSIAETLGMKGESAPLEIPRFSDEDYKNIPTAKFTEDVYRFTTGMVGAGKLLSTVKPVTTAGQFTKSTVQGAIADFTVMDPHEKRLSNLIQEHPSIANPVTELLAANPDDSELIGRLKNSLEGAFLGMFMEAGVKGATQLAKAATDGVDAVKAMRVAKLAGKQIKAVDDLSDPMAKVAPVETPSTHKMYETIIEDAPKYSPYSDVAMMQRTPDKEMNLPSAMARWTDDVDSLKRMEAKKQAQIDEMWDGYYRARADKELDWARAEVQAEDQWASVKKLDELPRNTEAEREAYLRARQSVLTDAPPLSEREASQLAMQPLQESEERIQDAMRQFAEAGKVTDQMAKKRYMEAMAEIANDHKWLKENNLSGDELDDWLLRRPVDGQSVRMQTETAIARGDIPSVHYATPEERIFMAGSDGGYDAWNAAKTEVRKGSVEVSVNAVADTVSKGVDELDSLIKKEIAAGNQVTTKDFLDGNVPWGTAGMFRTIGKMGEAIDERLTDSMGLAISRPIHKLEIMGPAGKELGRLMRHTELNIDTTLGSLTHEISKAMKGLEPAEIENLARIRQGLAKPTSARQKAVADMIKQKFDDTVDQAVKVGIYTKEKGAELKSKDWWPRVYDQAYLLTREGEKHWEDVLMQQKWSKESLENALEHILHGDKDAIGQFITKMTKDGSGSYTMSRDMARQLRIQSEKSKVLARSGHLEKARTLSVENEEILAPFLVKDPQAVLTTYFSDAVRRLEMAKTFGANDEVAEQLFRSLANTQASQNHDFARNVFYQMAGDSRSKNVAAQANMRAGAKRIMGQIDALTTLKLSGSAIVNAGQTLVNGPVYMAKANNPAKAFIMSIKGIGKAFTKEGKEFAARAGAANETVLMEMAGEAMVQHSIMGRQLRGVFSPLEWVNNPTKFLKMVGFIAVEKMNRRIAANMGRVYFEDLMARKANIEAAMAAGKKFSNKELLKVKRAMEELYLPWDVAAKDLTAQQADLASRRAGLAFSDTVNYRNTATQLPQLWGSPYARLFRKFKTFIFHHGAFIKDQVIKPAAKEGNFGPLMTYLGVGTAVGMSTVEFRKMINGDDEELTGTERYLAAMTAVGGLGIMQDTLASLTSGYAGKAVGFMGGPFVGDVARFLTDVRLALPPESKLSADQVAARAALNVFGTLPLKKQMKEELKAQHERKRASARRARQSRPSRPTRRRER